MGRKVNSCRQEKGCYWSEDGGALEDEGVARRETGLSATILTQHFKFRLQLQFFQPGIEFGAVDQIRGYVQHAADILEMFF